MPGSDIRSLMAFPHHCSLLIDTIWVLSHNRRADLFAMARQLTSIGLLGVAIVGLYIFALVNSFGF
ncbi:MAG: hypothetical protein ISP81_01530 [Synechococcus sp. BS301-5m-G54]|jgi:hypothetical protein|uniref:hypothetical protein n=1 Tax=Synechococcus sp. KORDI-49 TaxID=585423 RepID=UPI0004E0AD11|nr:hypothetical protein [Synechococcus sp. KORDI-49]AII45564.1 hypothetical protein KR49_03700 [Synechococcus sp. KORDI-49]MBL6738799.1 hypothetical protein [Synechococcus sp. BS301-5m-G54]MBL6795485.1 hypothetical protein [Synechococcus sp. BS307-5m-G34]